MGCGWKGQSKCRQEIRLGVHTFSELALARKLYKSATTDCVSEAEQDKMQAGRKQQQNSTAFKVSGGWKGVGRGGGGGGQSEDSWGVEGVKSD